MRGPTPDEILATQPPEVRVSSKSTQVYLDMRRRILQGEFATDQLISPKSIENEYHVNTNGVQALLLRLAIEGLIKIYPVKEKVWPNNAALNEYRIANLNVRERMLSTRQGDFVPDILQQNPQAFMETLILKVQYADTEVARLLSIDEGDKVIFHRVLQKRDPSTVVAIADTYFPFWFVEMMPELEKPDNDVFQLMLKMEKRPWWCTETVDVVQATSVERVMFGLSPDDPSALLKILRQTFDDEGNPLLVDFLTDRGDTYRLHYSFPLFKEGVPPALRDK